MSDRNACRRTCRPENWDDKHQCWLGIICQVRKDDAGQEFIMVYDVEKAETQVEVDDWIKMALATKPWEKRK